jgi:hypothetical protein
MKKTEKQLISEAMAIIVADNIVEKILDPKTPEFFIHQISYHEKMIEICKQVLALKEEQLTTVE